MPSRRVERINEQMKREIADILRNHVRDPRIGTPVVTGVRTSSDLTLARVFIMATGDEAEQKQQFQGLEAAAPYIRGELGRRMQLRKVPELRFERDQSLEYGMRIERLLEETRAKPAKDDEEEETGET